MVTKVLENSVLLYIHSSKRNRALFINKTRGKNYVPMYLSRPILETKPLQAPVRRPASIPLVSLSDVTIQQPYHASSLLFADFVQRVTMINVFFFSSEWSLSATTERCTGLLKAHTYCKNAIRGCTWMWATPGPNDTKQARSTGAVMMDRDKRSSESEVEIRKARRAQTIKPACLHASRQSFRNETRVFRSLC
jgi:hypothetical protein